MPNNPFLLKVSFAPDDQPSDRMEPLIQIYQIRGMVAQLDRLVNTVARLSGEDGAFAQHLLIPGIVQEMSKIDRNLLPPSLREEFGRLDHVLQTSDLHIWEVRQIASNITRIVHGWVGTSHAATFRTSRRESYSVRMIYITITSLSIFCVIIAGFVIGRGLLISRASIEEQTIGASVMLASVVIVLFDQITVRREPHET